MFNYLLNTVNLVCNLPIFSNSMSSFFFNNYSLLVSSYSLSSLYCYYKDTIDIDSLKDKINIKDKKKLNDLYKKYLPLVSFNVIIMAYLCGYINTLFINKYNPELLKEKGFDELKLIDFMELYFCKYITDISFYTCHRITHLKYIYKYIHKTHHQVKNNIGLAGLYTDPIDFFTGNFLPIMGPVSYIFTHQYIFKLWILSTVYNVVIVSHGGFSNYSEYHDIHHTKFKYNYGTDIFMDVIFNTKYIDKKKNLQKIKNNS